MLFKCIDPVSWFMLNKIKLPQEFLLFSSIYNDLSYGLLQQSAEEGHEREGGRERAEREEGREMAERETGRDGIRISTSICCCVYSVSVTTLNTLS